MNSSIEIPDITRRQKRFNLTLLTEARQNLEDSRGLTSQFRIVHKRTTRLHKQKLIGNVMKKTIPSFKNLYRKNGVLLGSSSNKISSYRAEAIIEQIEASRHKKQLKQQNMQWKILQQIFQLGEIVNENLYNYKNLQAKLKILNKKAKQLKSTTFEFYCFTISGLILYEYQSLSLTIFYFDKALKALAKKKIVYFFDFKEELKIYRIVAKVFLQSNKLKQARDMAYMYLRKTWRYHNIDEQMNAYDLLGQIELQDGNIQMSRYFHWRMCYAITQQKQILHLSNQQLQKTQRKALQFFVFQDIMQFVRNQQQIVSILSNHFRSEAQQQVKGFTNFKKNKQVFLYTHRSSNRLLRNHRSLQRKLIDEKQSKQIHFICSKDIKKIKKILIQFTSFIFDLKKQMQKDIFTRKQQISNTIIEQSQANKENYY